MNADGMEQVPEGPKQYRWEAGYQRTWEVIKEAVEDDAQRANESKIEAVYRQLEDRSKRKRMALTQKTGLKLGMLRHLYIVVDFSKAALQQDLKPTRITVILQQTKQFIRNFFDQNPLGNIGLIITKERKANIMTPLSCTPKIHFYMLDNIAAMIKKDPDAYCLGEPSLQIALLKAATQLCMLDEYFSKEIVVIMNSLTTCDSGDVRETLDYMNENGVKINVIHLGAQVEICKTVAKTTGGKLVVPNNELEFEEALIKMSKPPPKIDNKSKMMKMSENPENNGNQQNNSENSVENSSSKSTMLKMGFPLFKKYNSTVITNGQSNRFRMVSRMAPNSQMELKHEANLSNESYQCPQCRVHVSCLPIQCPTCNLQLVTSAHLARSHHHLFPVKKFKNKNEGGKNGDSEISSCDACGVNNVKVGKNPDSGKRFCLDCELFMREKLHFAF